MGAFRAQAVEGDGQGAGLREVVERRAGVGARAAELLDHAGEVGRGHVRPQRAAGLGVLDEAGEQTVTAPGGRDHLVGDRQGAGERGEGSGAEPDAGVHVAAQRVPGLVHREALLGGGDVLFHREDAQPLQQLGLAAVAPVEAAHADAGPLGHGGHRGVPALGREDLAGRVEDLAVVAGCLLLAPAGSGHLLRLSLSERFVPHFSCGAPRSVLFLSE